MPVTPKLTPANQNPWYVLMTLYGASGDEPRWDDGEQFEKNRWAWNAWATQHMSSENLIEAGLGIGESGAWERNRDEYEALFLKAFEQRAGVSATGNMVPDAEDVALLSHVHFDKVLDLTRFIFPS